MLRHSAARLWRTHPIVCSVAIALVLGIWIFHSTLYTTWTLITMPLAWYANGDATAFTISSDTRDFDITFANYSRMQSDAGEGYRNQVPAIMHHIAFGAAAGEKWQGARQTCLDLHPEWETHLWNEEKADQLMREKFPQYKEMWDSYPFFIEKIDVLRYFILYEYGGAYLDMDLKCNRALGPLRRYEFIAPRAHPVGMSNSFVMASKRNALIGSIIDNLPRYKKHWFMLPYPTVMFSTGCHYVSTIHSLQPKRNEYKILGGTKENPKLNSPNGHASTPLFEHLGSSSWHSWDAAVIVWFGHITVGEVILIVMAVVAVLYVVPKMISRMQMRARFRRWWLGRRAHYKQLSMDIV